MAHQPMTKPVSTVRYNVDHLPRRLLFDLASAIVASGLVAPLVTLLDKSIVLRTHSAEPLRSIIASSLRTALRRPLAFLTSTPYLLIHGLYASTYLAANATDTWLSALRTLPLQHISSGPEKFAATSAVNMSVCLYKDARCARFFGAAADTTAQSAIRMTVPRTSLVLFATRDALTIFASFNAPALLAPWLGGSLRLAQFAAPAAVQLVSTPLHLLGLDLYNRPGRARAAAHVTPGVQHRRPEVGWRDRWHVVRRGGCGASLARMGRIIPAYGVGGLVNRELRTKLMQHVETRR